MTIVLEELYAGGWKLLSAIRKKRYLVWNFGDRPTVFSASGEGRVHNRFSEDADRKGSRSQCNAPCPCIPPEAKTDNAFPWRASRSSFPVERELLAVFLHWASKSLRRSEMGSLFARNRRTCRFGCLKSDHSGPIFPSSGCESEKQASFPVRRIITYHEQHTCPHCGRFLRHA